jgi:hypothetical protein
MNVTNVQLESFNKVFNKLLTTPNLKSVKTQFQVYKIAKELDAEYKSLISFRMNIEKQYFKGAANGELEFDENKSPILIEGKDLQDYIKGLDELFSQGVNIATLDNFTIKLEELQPLVDNGELVGADFSVLEYFVKE